MTACINVDICGTEELEASSSKLLGECLRCRGYYDTKDKKLQNQIFYTESKGKEYEDD